MTPEALTVQDNLVVSLEYTLRLDTEEVVDSSAGQPPLEFLQGYGNIIPGLEQALYGMSLNEDKTVIVTPEHGYGESDPQKIQIIPRNAFPPTLDLTPGLGIRMRDENTGHVFEAYVVETRGDEMVMDFNHPLAGETLFFEVKVVGLRQPTDEELAHGHVHSGEHHHH